MFQDRDGVIGLVAGVRGRSGIGEQFWRAGVIHVVVKNVTVVAAAAVVTEVPNHLATITVSLPSVLQQAAKQSRWTGVKKHFSHIGHPRVQAEAHSSHLVVRVASSAGAILVFKGTRVGACERFARGRWCLV